MTLSAGANTDNIKKVIYGLNGKRALAKKDDNDKDDNEMVKIFNEAISNILINYVPYDTISFDDHDHPLINNKIKKLLHEKNEFCNKLKPSIQNETTLRKLKYQQNHHNNATDTANVHYCKRKLKS